MSPRIRDRQGRFLSPTVCEAVHEASHAIAALSLNIRVRYVTLVDELEDGGGGTCSVSLPPWLGQYLIRYRAPREVRDSKRRGLIERYIIQGRAGYIGECLLAGRERPYDTWKQSRHLGSDSHHSRISAALLGISRWNTRAYVESLDMHAYFILRKHWADVRRLTHYLMESYRNEWAPARISGAECNALCPSVAGYVPPGGRRVRYVQLSIPQNGGAAKAVALGSLAHATRPPDDPPQPR